MQDLCKQLQPIIESEDNESGEYCQCLVDICRYTFCMSDEFANAVINVMQEQIQLHRESLIPDTEYWLGLTPEQWAKGILNADEETP